LLREGFIDNLFILVAFLTGSDRVPILGMKSMKVREKYVGSSEKLNARRETPYLKATNINDVFDDFPKISDHFPKVSEDSPQVARRPDERFLRLPKNSEEASKMFRSYTKHLSCAL